MINHRGVSTLNPSRTNVSSPKMSFLYTTGELRFQKGDLEGVTPFWALNTEHPITVQLFTFAAQHQPAPPAQQRTLNQLAGRLGVMDTLTMQYLSMRWPLTYYIVMASDLIAMAPPT